MRTGQRLAPPHRFVVTLNSVETKLKWGDVVEDYVETFSVDLQRKIIHLSVLEDRDRRVSRLFMNMVEMPSAPNAATDFQLVHTDADTKARLIFENVTITTHLLEGYGYDQGMQQVTHRVELTYTDVTIEPKDPPVH